MSDISGRRWNQLINAVNNNRSKEEVIPAMNAEEERIFCNMQKELEEMREKQGEKAAFWPVEIESDDEGLDIYHD